MTCILNNNQTGELACLIQFSNLKIKSVLAESQTLESVTNGENISYPQATQATEATEATQATQVLRENRRGRIRDARLKKCFLLRFQNLGCERDNGSSIKKRDVEDKKTQ